MDLSVREDLEDTCLRDSISIASTDSFVSAAEVREKSDVQAAVHQFTSQIFVRYGIQHKCVILGCLALTVASIGFRSHLPSIMYSLQ